jgi:hypothetical protein
VNQPLGRAERDDALEQLLVALDAELPFLLTAQSPKGASGSGWTMRVVRWREGATSVRGFAVRCTPDLFAPLVSHLRDRPGLVVHPGHPPGRRPPFSLTGRQTVYVRPAYEKHAGFQGYPT